MYEPKPTAELRREGRLARIAKALASGATVTDIAEAEGIGRTLASREANSPECRQLIAEFVSDERDEMRAMFYRALRAIEHAFSARREYMTKEGQIRLWRAGSLCAPGRDEALSRFSDGGSTGAEAAGERRKATRDAAGARGTGEIE